MTYPPQPPVMPGNPQPPADWTPPPAEPERKSRSMLLLIGALVVAVLVVGGLVAALVAQGNKDTSDKASTATTVTAATPVIDEPTTVPTQAGPTPLPRDFELTPKITDKQCFGTAGCSVDLKVKLAYSGPTLSDEDTWQVTYEVTGDEDGPVIGSFEVTGETYEVNTESLSTKNSKVKITIKVTAVEKVGI